MSHKGERGRMETHGADTALPTDPEETISQEIERLESELGQAKEAVDESFLSLNESGTLICLGALGVLGSAWLAARLVQAVLPPELITQTDFMVDALRSAQKGLGPRGGAMVAGLGWLLLIGLVGLYLWQQLGDGEKRVRSLWAAWGLGALFISFPFFEFRTTAATLPNVNVLAFPFFEFRTTVTTVPSVSVLVGLAIVSGIYIVAAILQRSERMALFFSWLGKSWFGALYGGTALVLILTGILLPAPRAWLAGMLLASCLSLKALLLGIHKLAKTREVHTLRARITFLLEQRAREEEKRRVREQLNHFVKSGTTPAV